MQTLRAGDIGITPAGKANRWRLDEEVEVVLLQLAPTFLLQIAAGVGVVHPERIELLDNFGTRDPRVADIGQSLLSESQAAGFASHLYVESLAKQLAIHLIRHYSTISAPVEDFRAQLPSYKLRRATEYINANLGEHLTLSKISDALAMSPCHFAHVFKQATGLPPHRYVMERRIERAKSLLRETDLSVAEIAKQVGYSNQCHFSVVFHKFTGEAPRRYKNGVAAIVPDMR